MKTLAIAALVGFGLIAGPAHARDVSGVWTTLSNTASRLLFDQIQDTAPRSVFDQIQDTAPRSLFDPIRDSAPRSEGGH